MQTSTGSYLEQLKLVLLELADSRDHIITAICDEIHVPRYHDCIYILRRELEEAFDQNGVLVKPLRIFHTSERPFLSLEWPLRDALWQHGFEVRGSHILDGHPRIWIVPHTEP